MRLNSNFRMPRAASLEGFEGNESAIAQEQTSPDREAEFFKEPAAILDLSLDALKKDANSKSIFTDPDIAQKNSNSNGIEDASGRLTRMLVAAKSKEEIIEVLSQAYKNLGDALMAAAGGDEKAMDIVRRLNKLIRRANRKIRDLDNESETKRNQKRAEKKQLEQLAKQLEDELKRKLAQRKKREKRYLADANPKVSNKQNRPFNYSTAALEAKIRMLEFAHKMTGASSGANSIQAETSGSISPASESADANTGEE